MADITNLRRLRNVITAELDPASPGNPLVIPAGTTGYPQVVMPATIDRGPITILGNNTFRIPGYLTGDFLSSFILQCTSDRNADHFSQIQLGIGLWPPPGAAPFATITVTQAAQGADNRLSFVFDSFGNVIVPSTLSLDIRIAQFHDDGLAATLTFELVRSYYAQMGYRS